MTIVYILLGLLVLVCLLYALCLRCRRIGRHAKAGVMRPRHLGKIGAKDEG